MKLKNLAPESVKGLLKEEYTGASHNYITPWIREVFMETLKITELQLEQYNALVYNLAKVISLTE